MKPRKCLLDGVDDSASTFLPAILSLFGPTLACINQFKARLYNEGCDLHITVNIRVNTFTEIRKRLIIGTSIYYLSALRVIEIWHLCRSANQNLRETQSLWDSDV